MSVTVEGVVKVALDRVKDARKAADNVSSYSSGTEALHKLKLDLDIAAELLALIVPQPAHDAT